MAEALAIAAVPPAEAWQAARIPKQPEARLSTTWHTLSRRPSITTTGWARLPSPLRYNVRDARRRIINHILGTQRLRSREGLSSMEQIRPPAAYS
jgi:hypothetical protein